MSTSIALISDIHANLPALEAVLADIDGRTEIEHVYHIGDLVGYAPWPDETVALCRARGIAGVAGNYDSTVATGHPHCGCQYDDPVQQALSSQSYAWTLRNTSPSSKAWLGRLPFRLDIRLGGGHASGSTVILVHGTPLRNTVYWTGDRDDDFCTKMADLASARAGDVLAFGHTHKPWWRTVEDVHFVNTGSVGRPKDGDARAGYVVLNFDDGQFDVTFRRIEYDVQRAMAAILESDLPDEFAYYLESGGTRLSAGGA